MSYRYLVLGSGMQGTAAAYYLGKFGSAEHLILADRSEEALMASQVHLQRLLPQLNISTRLLDATDQEQLVGLLTEVHGCFSATDYSLNLLITQACIEAGCSMVDLGGNTDIVLQQLKLSYRKDATFSIIPDCGLAPGLGNSLAAYGIELFEKCESVKIRCGGLPQNPKPPLGYKLVFSVRGLTNEYFGKALVLENGKVSQKEAFSDLESLEFSSPVGKCEAFVTTGGTSTAPYSFEGQVQSYDYKTVRYPGHYEKMKCLLDLGLLDEKPIQIGDQHIVPREVFHHVAPARLAFPQDKDLVVMRVDCQGEKDGQKKQVRFEMQLMESESLGFSAMEMGTGFPAALALIYAVEGKAEKGVVSLEKALPNRPYFEDLTGNGLAIFMNELLLEG